MILQAVPLTSLPFLPSTGVRESQTAGATPRGSDRSQSAPYKLTGATAGSNLCISKPFRSDEIGMNQNSMLEIDNKADGLEMLFFPMYFHIYISGFFEVQAVSFR